MTSFHFHLCYEGIVESEKGLEIFDGHRQRYVLRICKCCQLKVVKVEELSFKSKVHLMDFHDQMMKKPQMKIHYFILNMESSYQTHHRKKRMGGWDGGWSKSGSITSSHFGDKRTVRTG